MNKTENIIKYVFSGILGLIFVLFFYLDANSIIRQGVDVWNALYQHRLFEYYKVANDSFESGKMVSQACYGMSCNILLAIWELPVWIYERLSGQDYRTSYLMMYWGKLYVPIGFILLLRYSDKIYTALCGEELKARPSYLILTSSVILVNIFMCSQIDVVSMALVVIAIYKYLEGKKQYFYLYFILAIQLKYFSWFIFVPLVLLTEKRLEKVFCKIFTPLIISFLIDFPFRKGATEIGAKSGRISEVIGQMFDSRIQIWDTYVPIIVLLYGLICLLCYLKKEYEKIEILWVATVSSLVFFMCFHLYPYWCIYFMPFICIIVACNGLEDILLFLLMLGENILLLSHYMVYDWCYGASSSLLIDSQLYGVNNADSVHDYYTLGNLLYSLQYKMGLERMDGIFMGIFSLAMLLIMWFSKYGNKEKYELHGIQCVGNWRIAINLLASLVPFVHVVVAFMV